MSSVRFSPCVNLLCLLCSCSETQNTGPVLFWDFPISAVMLASFIHPRIPRSMSHPFVTLFLCSLLWLPACVSWIRGGRRTRPRQMTRWRRGLFVEFVPACHPSSLIMLALSLLFAVVTLVTRRISSIISHHLSSVNSFLQVSLHPPLQVLLIYLGLVVSTTIGCGIPFLCRRLVSKIQCFESSNSSRFDSFAPISSRHCLEGFTCGFGSGCSLYWLHVLEIPDGLSPYYTVSYLPNGMIILVRSPLILFRSPASSEEKLPPSYPLPMDRGTSSDSIPSVCFSSFIGLLSCGAVSTGPEDAIETTLVVFVDDIWTSTSLYVTIIQPPDFVAKALSTHSSIVSNSLSSSSEDLSYLAYYNVVAYAFYLRG